MLGCGCVYWPATTMLGWIRTSYNNQGWILTSHDHVRVMWVDNDQLQPCEGGGYWPATAMWGWILTCYNHVGVVTEKRQYCGVMRLIYWAGPTMWGWIRTSYNNVEGWYWPATQSGGEYWPATTMWEWCEWILSCYNHVGMVTYQLKPCGVMELIYWPATIMIWQLQPVWGWILTCYDHVGGCWGCNWPATTMWTWSGWFLTCYSHVGMVTVQLQQCGVGGGE